MLFRLAVIVTVPSKGSSADRVSVFPDLETDTLLLELEKLNSASTPFVSVNVITDLESRKSLFWL